MAVPTITDLDVESGNSHGREIVRITGTGFAGQIAVTFGGEAATVLSVYTSGGVSVADVSTPKAAEPGAADVVVTNLDAEGDPVAGESVTEADGFTYHRLETTNDSDVSRLMRLVLQLLKREVMPTVHARVDIDFDETPDDGVRITPLAKSPSLSLLMRTMSPNTLLRRMQRKTIPAAGGNLDVLGPSVTVDLGFTLVLNSTSQVQLLNMVTAVVRFLNANPRISMLADASDPDSGMPRWRLSPVGDVSMLDPRNKVHVATMDMTVRGFDLDGGLPLTRTRTVDEVAVAADAMGG